MLVYVSVLLCTHIALPGMPFLISFSCYKFKFIPNDLLWREFFCKVFFGLLEPELGTLPEAGRS